MGQYHYPGLQLLINLLQDAEWLVRSDAADDLGELGDVQAVPFLLPVLKDEDWMVRRSAARSLALLKQEEAVEALLEALHDEDEEVFENVIKALQKIAEEAKGASQPSTGEDLESKEKLVWSALEAIKRIKLR